MKKIFLTIELFLIVLIVLLFGFLFFIFTHKQQAESLAEVPIVVDTSELYCGITVTDPEIGKPVSFPLSISGYVSGCGWNPYHGYAAHLIFRDKDNRMISRRYLVHTTDVTTSPVSSQFHITIQKLPVALGQELFLEFTSFDNEKTFTFPVTVGMSDENDIKL